MSYVHVNPWFFRFGAVSALASALAVLIAQLWLTIDAPSPGILGIIGIYAEPLWRAKSLTILVQVGLMFLALLAVATKLWPRSPSVVLLALPFLLFWQLFELIPRAIDLFAASYQWAPAYLDASDPSIRAALEERFRFFWSTADAMGELRRVCWALLHLLLGIAVLRVGGWPRIVAVILLLNSLRLAIAIIGAHFGLAWLAGGITGFIIMMVLQFLLVAIWLWSDPYPVREISDELTQRE